MGSIDRFTLAGGAGVAGCLDASFVAGLDSWTHHRAWTQAEVVALLEALHPAPSGKPGDQAVLRQQLASAFLAGAAESFDACLFRPPRSLISTSIAQAGTLLKNRAASQHCRLWHAFVAGVEACRTAADLAAAGHSDSLSSRLPRTSPAAGVRRPLSRGEDARALRLFVRQPLTESGQAQQALIASVLQQIETHNGQPHSFRFLTGRQAECADSFRQSFEAESGQAFTPQTFRAYRLHLLSQADAFVNIRVGMSESSAFELSYHVFRGACTPVLFLVWKHAPIKTTLLKDLGNLCDVTYLEFEHADEIRAAMGEFFRRCTRRGATLDANERASCT